MKDAGGKVLADLMVGKAIGGYTMVRPFGKNEVWQSTGIYGYMMNREPKAWRDHTVLEFTQIDADKLTVDAGGGQKLVLEKVPAEKDKPGSETKWKIGSSTGDGPKTSDALDVSMVNGALQSLATLKAVDFADDKNPDSTGLAKPWLTVTAHAAGKDYTLLIGMLVGDSVYVKNAESPVLYSVNKYAVERVAHKPIDYRDKTLTNVKEVDLASMDVAFGGDPWTVDRGADGRWKGRGKNIDETKLKAIVNGFDKLQADGYADEKDPAKTGLAKPAALVTLHLRDKSTVGLKLGGMTPDQLSYYTQRVGSTDVMKVKKFVGDRMMKKAADMAPGAKGGAPTPQEIIAAEQAKNKKKKP
jgi:hypothetical protein